MYKRLHSTIYEKVNLRITKNYQCITLTTNALFLNHIQSQEIYLKNQNVFWRNQITTSQFITTITILCKDTKVTICSPDGNTNYFDVVIGVFEIDTLAPVRFIHKLATLVNGNPNAPFSIATTSRWRGGRYSIPRIASLYPWSSP